MSTSLRYSHILEIAHAVLGNERRSTTNSRLKQWQRMGFPPGVNIGRGNKRAYSIDEAWQIALVAEMGRIGFPAQTAIRLLGINAALVEREKAVADKPAVFMIDLQGRRSGVCIDFPFLAQTIARTVARVEMESLIEAARHQKMTPQEKFEQRVSFAYGQQDYDNPNRLTKDEVRQMLIESQGCP